MSFPEKIFIKRDNKFVEYHKDYEHEKGGCYYRNDNEDDWVFGNAISLYPDGHLTYLWDEYREFMCNKDNSHCCADCPENMNYNGCANLLPCGQQNCWVDITCDSEVQNV